ncbi:NAD-dependent epimerase/dehydratase family protein [Janibacter indicus]|uniref:NAD-dependent epimerase/dehydratase family protein n=1 Tax=Janibacter indicus TaxID=857417 RepID=A0A7L9J1Q6_9MICO|nr:NAD-dependent epimerase/dehydratase family protein [Janibacter indicus]QOK23571.1 NAD-dependent epimerase/dehydratase family protein [Janibacter indicus]
MHILITGGAGFVGSNLARTALEQGHSVRVIDDLSTGYRDNLDGLDVDFIEGSINERGKMDQAIAGVDSVVHLAALGSVPRSIQNPIATHQANVDGTLSVLESARSHGIDHVIFSSSSSVYGMNPAMPKQEREWVRPMSPYAVSKLAAEQYVLAYGTAYGIESLAFRFFNVYGPGQRAGHVYAAVIPVFIDALMKGEPLPINGDGSNSRDFTYVGTVCRVLLDAVERKVSHSEPVNLAFGTNTTLLELIDEIADVSGQTPELLHRDPRPGDVAHSQANNDSLRALFPDVEPVSLPDGLSATHEWFQKGREAKG